MSVFLRLYTSIILLLEACCHVQLAGAGHSAAVLRYLDIGAALKCLRFVFTKQNKAAQ